MKIAVSATEGSLDADVDIRFGRCPYYVIFEVEGKEIKSHEIVKNTADEQMSGAGITAAQTVVNKDVGVIITGNLGPKAFDVLSSSGIKIVTGIEGNVKEAVENYLKGEIKETKQSRPGFGMGRRLG